jgi:uncharacterized membrane protein YphA (DoxX/SURF4 family)
MVFANKKRLIPVINFLLVWLFAYTGSSKLFGHELFKEQLTQVNYLKPMAAFMSIALPVTEILTGLLIVYKPTARAGLWLAAILLATFTIHVSIMLAGDKTNLPCSCGGVLKALSWKNHLWFNIMFMLLACCNIYLTGIRKREQAENP